ncbi:hypothetical protein C032_02695 [Brucella abortus 63/294]|nr:hypothetical protein C032_02695 [Brucella abortus 63/294]ENS08180.1 hypothetical protein C980_02672 [Brucella abortus 88/217]ERU11009.1 hypothetical protein P039_00371 [Brucella abortus 07-0994-2411]
MFNSINTSKAAAGFVFWVLCAASITLPSLPHEAGAAPLVTRSQRCERLKHQLQTALSGHVKIGRVHQVEVLQRRGARFCASKRQAQGLRAYAEALKLLGVKPDMAEPGTQGRSIPPKRDIKVRIWKMKKSLISALGLAVVLGLSAPVLAASSDTVPAAVMTPAKNIKQGQTMTAPMVKLQKAHKKAEMKKLEKAHKKH